MEHTEFAFLSPHNPGDYPHRMGSAQDWALGPENFEQNQALFENTLSWMEPWKNRSSRRWNQSSYPHWWIRSHVLDRCPHLPCYRIYLPDTGRSKKIDLKINAFKMMGPYDPRWTAIPTNLTVRGGGGNLQEQEASKSPTLWLCQKESPFWRKRGFLIT